LQTLLLYDAKLSQRLLLTPKSGWWKLMRLIAHLGDGQYIFGALLVVYLVARLEHNLFLRQVALIVFFIEVATFLVVTSLKFLIRRQRPNPPGEFVALPHDKYSFPSGHSARMAALSFSTIFFYSEAGWILVIITLAVSLARIGVGVHYLSDVIAGFAAGAITALGGVMLLYHFFPL
jgi:undecaprenyl-diphosphatase